MRTGLFSGGSTKIRFLGVPPPPQLPFTSPVGHARFLSPPGPLPTLTPFRGRTGSGPLKAFSPSLPPSPPPPLGVTCPLDHTNQTAPKAGTRAPLALISQCRVSEAAARQDALETARCAWIKNTQARQNWRGCPGDRYASTGQLGARFGGDRGGKQRCQKDQWVTLSLPPVRACVCVSPSLTPLSPQALNLTLSLSFCLSLPSLSSPSILPANQRRLLLRTLPRLRGPSGASRRQLLSAVASQSQCS